MDSPFDDEPKNGKAQETKTKRKHHRILYPPSLRHRLVWGSCDVVAVIRGTIYSGGVPLDAAGFSTERVWFSNGKTIPRSSNVNKPFMELISARIVMSKFINFGSDFFPCFISIQWRQVTLIMQRNGIDLNLIFVALLNRTAPLRPPSIN